MQEATVTINPNNIRELTVNLPDGRRLPLRNWESSKITHADYDESTSLCFIAFPANSKQPQGSVYEYAGVEVDTWEGFEEAKSKGSYAGQFIIGPRGKPIYPFRKVEMVNPMSPAPRDAAAEAVRPAAIQGEVVDTIPELPEKDEELVTRALAVREEARSLAITTPEHYTVAANRLTTIKAERKLVEARLNRVYEPAYKAYKEALALKQEALAPFDQAESILKDSMLRYTREEEAIRRRAEAEERARLEAAAREEAKREAEENAKRDAEHAEAQGEAELADQIRANPVPVAPKPVAPVVMERAVPTVKGVAVKENWQYRIVDESKIPLSHDYYTLDLKKIGAKAKLLKSHANIPGVEVYDAGTIAAR